tara:strand:+ start:310 stop:522 length:213 start_codon:yes stop_codon:yes gene_type:complete
VLIFPPLRSLLSETTEKKIREREREKRKVSEGQFSHQKEEKLSKEETNKYAFRREIRGGKRAQTQTSLDQ